MVRQAQGRTREAILDATVDLLRQSRDPDAVTIDAVVGKVGCTPPTLYYYFPTKQHLLFEACEREYVKFAVDLLRDMPRDAAARDDIRSLGLAYLRWARAHPAEYALLFMTRLDVVDPAAQPGAHAGGMPDLHEVPGLGYLVRLLERAASEGLAIPDVTQATLNLWATVHGFSSLALTNQEIPAEMLERGLLEVCEGLLRTYR